MDGDEFLNLVLWTCDRFARPTLRQVGESYEQWAYRNGLLRPMRRLERARLIERTSSVSDSRVLRLTENGRLHILGGRDPSARWARFWDGVWRIAMFDVPVGDEGRRKKLRRYLQSRGFGCLQNSVWISPDPLDEPAAMADKKSNVKSLIFFQGRPFAGETDAAIVSAAWNWTRINHLYRKHLRLIDERPTKDPDTRRAAEAFQRWAALERSAFLAAVTRDPLLPQNLLPSDYLGKKSWQARLDCQPAVSKQIHSLAHNSLHDDT